MEVRQAAEMAALIAEMDAEKAQLESNIIKLTDDEHKDALSELHRDFMGEVSWSFLSLSGRAEILFLFSKFYQN